MQDVFSLDVPPCFLQFNLIYSYINLLLFILTQVYFNIKWK